MRFLAIDPLFLAKRALHHFQEALRIERGLVTPGMLVVGADSATASILFAGLIGLGSLGLTPNSPAWAGTAAAIGARMRAAHQRRNM